MSEASKETTIHPADSCVMASEAVPCQFQWYASALQDPLHTGVRPSVLRRLQAAKVHYAALCGFFLVPPRLKQSLAQAGAACLSSTLLFFVRRDVPRG